MRYSLAMSVIFVLAVVLKLHANDDARAIITKAIKAHGGMDNVAKLKSVRMKTKGTLMANDQAAEFTAEHITRLPDCFRLNMALEINTAKINITQVHRDKQAWQKIEAQLEEIKEERLKEQQARTHTNQVCSFLPLLKDKAYEMSPLGEIRIKDRPAVGVRVVCKGQSDINLYFDKETWLLVKTERRGLDLAQKDVARDTYYSDYKDYDGLKQARKLLVQYDGQTFLDMEVTEFVFPDSIPDVEFAQP